MNTIDNLRQGKLADSLSNNTLIGTNIYGSNNNSKDLLLIVMY
ncbi:MAG TPA: hypothetical protein VE818_00765 [Nitrososphaeraceae archaeon]|jgi:hypothetical protein|nr:hypothetical protein [Nitrososphaeraceae archaeon]